MLRLLVCGPRKWTNRKVVDFFLDTILEKHGEMVLIEGGATGVDRIAGEWADRNGDLVVWMRFPAPWNSPLKRRAGPVRNGRMLRFGNPTGVLAFQPEDGDTVGTQGMIRLAEESGVMVAVVRRPSNETRD